jgi:hypothetical protein
VGHRYVDKKLRVRQTAAETCFVCSGMCRGLHCVGVRKVLHRVGFGECNVAGGVLCSGCLAGPAHISHKVDEAVPNWPRHTVSNCRLPPPPPPPPLPVQVCDLYGLMCKLAGLPEGTPLLAFEEVKWEPEVMITELDPSQVGDCLGGWRGFPCTKRGDTCMCRTVYSQLPTTHASCRL